MDYGREIPINNRSRIIKGVFAAREFKRGDIVGMYLGKVEYTKKVVDSVYFGIYAKKEAESNDEESV